MRIIILLLISSVAIGQGRFPFPSAAPFASFASVGVEAAAHPITHDQTFVSHPNVVNGDYIGYVHYLCTDSIFNDHTGAYAWSIISGDPGGEYAIGSSTGLITVADAASISDDYTLGVQITNNGDLDTAICTIYYRTGTEGTVLVYFDDAHGGSDAGTFANPHTDLTSVDDYGQFDDGMTVLLKRGTSYTPNQWSIDNQGARIFLAAYGQGVKPIINQATSPEQIMKLGVYAGVGEGVDDCDSLTIMDIEFNGDGVTQAYAIYHEVFSQHNEYWRLKCDAINSTNGCFDFVGEHKAFHVMRDCEFINFTRALQDRVIKCESWGFDMENIWVLDNERPGIMTGLYGHAFGTLKYLYFDNTNQVRADGAIQVRDRGVDIEWMVTQDQGYGINFENYDYGSSGHPSPSDFSITNAIFNNPISGFHFYDNGDADSDTFDSIHIENVLVRNSTSHGINLSVSGASNIIEKIDIINTMVIDAGGGGINVQDSEVGEIDVSNSIFYGSTSNDVLTDGVLSAGTLINVIYQSISSTGHWNTFTTNYDYDSGNPFNNEAGGDYSSDSGASSVIDSGTDVSQAEDIIGNVITIQDIGAFNYTVTSEFNWTIR